MRSVNTGPNRRRWRSMYSRWRSRIAAVWKTTGARGPGGTPGTGARPAGPAAGATVVVAMVRDRTRRLPHRRVDRERAARPGHRHAVVPVPQRIAVADRHDRDGRQHRALHLGQPHALPARPRHAGGAEVCIELVGAGGLRRAADRGDRDLADAAPRRRPARGDLAAVVDGEARPDAAPPAEPADERSAPARPGGTHERLLRVDVVEAGGEHALMLRYAGRSHIGRMERVRDARA